MSLKIRNISIAVASVALAGVVVWMLAGDSESDDHQFFEVTEGRFEVLVTVTGELESENSFAIEAPRELQSRNIRLRNIPIHDMVSEGTEVGEGDWIATLDRTEAELSLRDLEDQMLSEEAQYNATILDTTIRLSGLRDELINLEHTVEERRLVLEQSAYEPPATIRQAEINLERAEMDFEQAKINYVLYEQQAAETVREAKLNLERRRRRFEVLEEVMDKFVITAPRAGMVIYHREWSGEKRNVGSSINPRDLTVAVMPDLTSLVSRAWVSEIDVNRVAEGQKVRIGIDAYPERSYTGTVLEVSNVGQELPNTDAKVFEVLLSVDQIDNILRPAMTTSNAIMIASYENVKYIPFAALHEKDGIPYVYHYDGTRQVVRTGNSNENFIIIEQGLDDGDLVYIEEPENHSEFPFSGTDIFAGDQL